MGQLGEYVKRVKQARFERRNRRGPWRPVTSEPVEGAKHIPMKRRNRDER